MKEIELNSVASPVLKGVIYGSPQQNLRADSGSGVADRVSLCPEGKAFNP
jgi:hypothetical protein